MKTRLLSLLLFLALFSGFLSACERSYEGKIMTVNGPIEVHELGPTLTHEHLLVDFIGADSSAYHRWDRDSVLARVLPFLEMLKDHKVQTFIDATPAYLGRDPRLLKMISEHSGLNILTNTGLYGAHGNKFLPQKAYQMSAEELAEEWIAEYENGIEGSGVFPGFIKIAVDRPDTLSEIHAKLIHAAALTHKASGLVIASHTGPDGPAFAQLNILKEEGVSPEAFIWVHAQRGSLDGNIRAGNMGAWISLDNLNTGRDTKPGSVFSTIWFAERILALKNAGLLDKVLLSHDAGWYSAGEKGGGSFRGYTGIFSSLLPELKLLGFTDEEIEQLLVSNPAQAFTIQKRIIN